VIDYAQALKLVDHDFDLASRNSKFRYSNLQGNVYGRRIVPKFTDFRTGSEEKISDGHLTVIENGTVPKNRRVVVFVHAWYWRKEHLGTTKTMHVSQHGYCRLV
jgi:hypothetical protein